MKLKLRDGSLITIGVHGTYFWGGCELIENGLYGIMLSGKRVFVKNNHRELVELEDDGFGTSVIDELAPNQPRKWVTDKVAKAVASITSQQF